MIRLSKEIMNYDLGKEVEWLVTNGIGGYASSTIINANTRKYHGLLIASLNPPVDRWLLLSKLEEKVVKGDKEYELSTNKYRDVIYPEGFRLQQEFSWDIFPKFTYRVGDVFIKKSVFMIHGFNATIISYEIKSGSKITFKVRPLVNARDFHTNLHSRHIDWHFEEKVKDRRTIINASFDHAPKLILGSDLADYSSDGLWVYDMVYEVENLRGYDDRDDHYSPGEFHLKIGKGESKFHIIALGSRDRVRSIFKKFYSQEPAFYEELLEKERARVGTIIKNIYRNLSIKEDPVINELARGTDYFVVDRKSTGAKSVIAGYPWFSDWGRDTMISLPGLTLVTGRFGDARKILKTYARYCNEGLIPNRFPDSMGEAEYNTADASLWFFYAVYKYLQYTSDYTFVKKELWYILKDIFTHYVEGTKFNIRMDSDGLIYAGSEKVQLTWMDAKIGELVVTPRHGKAVEINALWYNALKLMEVLSKKFGEDYSRYEELSDKVKNSFIKFWNEEKQCLYDIINEDEKDGSVRPNQIFSVSLPFRILDEEKERKIVSRILDELYTPYGLRSLSPKEEGYIGTYSGDQRQRDLAYHQGTVWPWLLGPFISAYMKINKSSEESRQKAEEYCTHVIEHLSKAGIGTVSEIFDGDFPHYPRGCISQAWSVAELLRCYVEDIKKGKENDMQ